MDLFSPLVPEADWHPNFRALMVPQFGDAERRTITEWARDFIDRDGKFVKEFQTTFNSSFWELYLHAAFREVGYRVDFSFSRPDFVITDSSGKGLTAEAVIASNADGYRPEWDRTLETYANMDRQQVLNYATIRIGNAIWSKYQKFKAEYANLAHVAGKAFVICLAPFEQPMFFVQNDHALRRVLYGFDEYLWLEGDDGSRIIVGEILLDKIVKDNGAVIPLGFFLSPKMPEISAVIFSNTATFTKMRALSKDGATKVFFTAVRYDAHSPNPIMIGDWRPNYHETLLDGLHVCLNPYARFPLDVSPFKGREVTIHDMNRTTGEYEPNAPHGFLFQHGCMSFVHGIQAAALPTVSESRYKVPASRSWEEGVLHPVPGQVMTFVDHHLAHYKGWTILVARDSCDNDWSAQATRGSFTCLADYHRADKTKDFLLAGEWHESKKLALQQIMWKIDESVNDRQD